MNSIECIYYNKDNKDIATFQIKGNTTSDVRIDKPNCSGRCKTFSLLMESTVNSVGLKDDRKTFFKFKLFKIAGK